MKKFVLLLTHRYHRWYIYLIILLIWVHISLLIKRAKQYITLEVASWTRKKLLIPQCLNLVNHFLNTFFYLPMVPLTCSLRRTVDLYKENFFLIDCLQGRMMAIHTFEVFHLYTTCTFTAPCALSYHKVSGHRYTRPYQVTIESHYFFISMSIEDAHDLHLPVL